MVLSNTMNINDYVWVKLTPFGEEIWNEKWAGLPKFDSFDPTSKISGVLTGVPDEIREIHTNPVNGLVSFPLWDLMNIFGSHMYLGAKDMPFEHNQIYFNAEGKE